MTLALVVLCAACATNPVTGKKELALISRSQEVSMGREAAEGVGRSIGIYPDSDLQDYVSRLGKTMAARSERPDLPWSFQVVDDPAVNAFALPGGFIFVTRGILAYLNSEAELVAVLGHEIGHVTARHSVNQMSKAQLAQMGFAVGTILNPEFSDVGEAAGTGLGLLFLKFGRNDERQADELGFRYALTGGYDVREMLDVFETLDRVGGSDDGGRLPEWLSTHPDPGNRRMATEARLAAIQQDLAGLSVYRGAYLKQIDGLQYGENPRHGYFEGAVFSHPDFQLRLDFPEGWKSRNQVASVTGLSPAQDALVELTLAREGTPDQAAQEFLSGTGLRAGSSSSENVNGLPAVTSRFTAQSGQKLLEGVVLFISHKGSVYRVVGYAPAARYQEYERIILKSLESFRPLTDPAALAVQPARLSLVEVERELTVEQFHRQFPSDIPLAQIALINGLRESSLIKAGQVMKRVTGGLRPR